MKLWSSWFVRGMKHCGKKRGAYQLVHGDLQNGSTRCWNYLEDYWPCAGGLSAMNVIGAQLRDPIKSALTQCEL